MGKVRSGETRREGGGLSLVQVCGGGAQNIII